MDKKVRRIVRKSAPEPEQEKPGLIDILAELCQCDPADVEWDGSGSIDTVAFASEGKRYILKLAKEPVQCSSSSVMDFRVRVVSA